MRADILNANTTALLLLCCALGACADDAGTAYPYESNTSTVIGAAISVEDGDRDALTGVLPVGTYTTPKGDECISVSGKNAGEPKCLKPQKDCGEDGTADVIVDEDGAVLAVLCYPNHDYAVQVIPDEAVDSPALGNNSVVVLDDEDDGADIEGDLIVEGNNVILYGAGPALSVIGGNLEIQKNNAIVRGVRIAGDVRIDKNNASLVACVIEGDLIITGNNFTLALCEVWGKITIDGNNTVFVSNLIAEDQVVAGQNLRCNDNHFFSDASGDGVVDSDDVLEALVCGP